MYFSQGNPNAINFTFDKIVQEERANINTIDMSDIALGRFILVQDMKTGLAHICVCVMNGESKKAEPIGLIPCKDATLTSEITGADLFLELRDPGQVVLHTSISYKTQTWNPGSQNFELSTGETTISDETPIGITFVDGDYVIFEAADDDKSDIDGVKFTLTVKL